MTDKTMRKTVPGVWRCAKCNFILVQQSLNAHTGALGARDMPGEKCPRDGAPLWRVTAAELAAPDKPAELATEAQPGAILDADDVPDGTLVMDGEGDCWVRFGVCGHVAFAPSNGGPPVRPWCGWDTRPRVPWARRGRFMVIAGGLTPLTATAEHLAALATEFEQAHGALAWSDGKVIIAQADEV